MTSILLSGTVDYGERLLGLRNRMHYEQERSVAIAAARRAASFCEQVRQSSRLSQFDKSDHSPVTIADFGAQAMICREITQSFPGDAIVAEENSAFLRQSPDQLEDITHFAQLFNLDATEENILEWIDQGQGKVGQRFWALDPIDGTKGFLRGDQYAIAIALIEEGEVKLGVMACPMFQGGCLFVAVRGQGSQMISLETGATQAIHVLQDSTVPQFRLTESVESSHGNPELQRAIARSVGLTAPSLQMDSQAKYGAIALGQAALYLRLPWVNQPQYQENIWDHAAGAIVVEEAGGTVTDREGKALDFTASSKLIHNRGIVVSNGSLHSAVLEALHYFQSESLEPR